MNIDILQYVVAIKHSVIISTIHLIWLVKMHGLRRKQYVDIGQAGGLGDSIAKPNKQKKLCEPRRWWESHQHGWKKKVRLKARC